MKLHRQWFCVAVLPALLSGCATRSPAAVSAASARNVDDTARAVAAPTTADSADVVFMRDMIGHHAQALLMTELLRTRTSRPDFHLLAERIDVSQRDEIALMERWLRARGQPVPAVDAHEHAMMGHGERMPGMLTQQDIQRLRTSSGAEFERLFLEYMIRHHQGAITMVERLFAQGGGQEPEVFMFASDVNADQAAEIRRMRALLRASADR